MSREDEIKANIEATRQEDYQKSLDDGEAVASIIERASNEENSLIGQLTAEEGFVRNTEILFGVETDEPDE